LSGFRGAALFCEHLRLGTRDAYHEFAPCNALRSSPVSNRINIATRVFIVRTLLELTDQRASVYVGAWKVQKGK